MICKYLWRVIYAAPWLNIPRLEGLVPNTPRPGGQISVNGSTVKRKSNFQTPSSKANKAHEMSSPGGVSTPKGESTSGVYVISGTSPAYSLISSAESSTSLLARTQMKSQSSL